MPERGQGVITPSAGELLTPETNVVAASLFRGQETTYRIGWAEASEKLAKNGDDVLVLPEIANKADAMFEW